MSRPAVSILMAVRDEEPYLAAAVNSMRRQSFGDWEMIIVDDGSTDGTPALLDDFARQDERIRTFRHEGKGLVDALNLGLQHCRAQLIARMDGDDISHPLRLEKQFRFLTSNPHVGLVACDIRHFPGRHVRGGMRHYEQWQNSLHEHDTIMRNLFVESPFVQPSVMFRRQAIQDAGGYRDMGWAEDYDLWLRLAEQDIRFARLPETLFYWREHGDRLTHTGEQCTLDAFRRCRAHFLDRGYLKGCAGVTLWGAGQEGKAWRRVLQQRGINVIRWIDVDPGKIGQIIHGARVDAPDDLAPGCGPMLITIGARGARTLVREKCHDLGLVESVDYICVT